MTYILIKIFFITLGKEELLNQSKLLTETFRNVLHDSLTTRVPYIYLCVRCLQADNKT